MADLLGRAKSALKNLTSQKASTTQHGATGTSIFSGILDVEFNSDLQGQEAIQVYDEMRRSDGTVIAILQAIKMPLLSAKWFIKAGTEDKKGQEQMDFINRALFEEVDFFHFLFELLGHLDFGYYYFEKVFKILPDDDPEYGGMVMWDKFAPRVPSAHYLWEIRNKPWKNGHPAGITQQLPGKTDEITKSTSKAVGGANQPEIPWDKLIIFSNRQEGNNYEGVSLLRPVYKHWFYKDLLYKISGISAERFGAGIPYAKLKKGTNSSAEDKIDEMLKNIKSNEQAYARISSDVEEWGIKTPDGDPKATAIDQLIQHHDRKIYDAILAGFLNLSTGEGGSNALSKDQSSFFLRALQSVAGYVIGRINPVIKELIDKNYTGTVEYPTLQVADIGNISMDEAVTSIALAQEKGLIMLTDSDHDAVREILKLPKLTKKEKKEIEQKMEEKETEEKERQEKMTKDEKVSEELNKKVDKVSEELSQVIKTVKTYNEKKVDAKELANEIIEIQLAQKKNLKPKPREAEFNRNITEYEGYLDDEWLKVEEVITKFDKIYRSEIIKIYKKAPTERIDGVVSLQFDKKSIKEADKAIDKITAKLEEKLINSPFQDRLFDNTKKAALRTMKQNDKFLQDFDIDEGRFNSFIGGYISNVQGELFNEPRRFKESVLQNFGSGTSVQLAIEQAEQLAFNRNIMKLSTVTHARAGFKGVIFGASEREGFTMYKVVVPNSKVRSLSPAGATAAAVFTIGTAAMINKKVSQATEGRAPDAVKGLGLHHGSFEYYYPIASDELDEEEEIATEQKRKLNESFEQ